MLLINKLKGLVELRSVQLFLFLMIIYNINLRIIATNDSTPANFLPISVIREFNLNLDEFSFLYEGTTPYFLTYYNNHLYSNYSVTTPILAVPIYFLPVILGFVKDAYDAVFLAKLSASVIASLSGVLFYLTMLKMTASQRFALLSALCYSLATSTWTISAQGLWDHTSGQFFNAAALFCVISARDDKRYLIPCGAACALAVTSRWNNLIPVLAISAYILFAYRKEAWKFLLFPLVISIWHLSLNLAHFGSIVGGAEVLLKQTSVRQGIFGGWSGSFTEGLAGVLISPSRGLIIFSPWLIFCFAGIIQVWRRNEDHLFKYISVGILFTILFFSKYTIWWGGLCYGPRFFVDIMPFMCIYIYFLRDQIIKMRSVRSLLVLFVVLSLVTQIIGAFCYSFSWYYEPTNVDYDHKRLWDWRDNEIVRSAQSGPQSPSFAYYLKDKLARITKP